MEKESKVVVEVETEKKTQTIKNVKRKGALDLNSPIEVAKENIEQPKVDERGKFAKFLNLKKKEKVELTEDAKKNRKLAWTGYILFFIPLLINKKSNFMRLHANEGLDVNIIDITAIILMLVGKLIKGTTILAKSILFGCFFLGLGLIFMTTITKIVMMISSMRGHYHQTPWLWKTRFIKDIEEK